MSHRRDEASRPEVVVTVIVRLPPIRQPKHRIQSLLYTQVSAFKTMSILDSKDRKKERLLLLLLVYVVAVKSQTVVDNCNNVHGREQRLGTVLASTAGLIVDAAQTGVFDGDDGRFKRTTASPGFLSYVSNRGFERIQIIGYVFGSLPAESWSLYVTEGDAVTTEATEGQFTLNSGNLQQYIQNQVGGGWNQFRIQLTLNTTCPDRITIALNGRASNNEYEGWGLQLSRIVLVQSWFDNCTASCVFEQGSCSSTASHQTVDPANDFRDVYSFSKNIIVDTSNARRFHDGDTGRFTRSSNDKGELLYVSNSGIQEVDIEIFQFRPYNTKLSVIPYMTDDCRPMVLPATYRTTRQIADGWGHRFVRFDLKRLPMCPTHLLIRIEGGQEGWELQISRLTFTVSGRLEKDSARTFQSESLDEDDDSGVDWWIYMIIIVVVIIVLLVAACLVRRFAHCCGPVQKERRLPVWNSSAWRRGQRAYETDIPESPTASSAPKKPAAMSIQQGNSFSFPVSKDVSLER